MKSRVVKQVLRTMASLMSLAFAFGGVQAQNAAQTGGPHDWSFRHVIATNAASPQAQAASRREVRILHNAFFRARSRNAAASPLRERRRATSRGFIVDWAVPVGTTEHVAIDQYPAKFSFSDSTPSGSRNAGSCLTDYVVFTLTQPAGGHANIIAINNLYQPSGSVTGQLDCGGPTVMFAYETRTNKAQANSIASPALSWDGSEVAFVDNEGATNGGKFRILKWAACGTCGFATPTIAAHTTSARPTGNQVFDLSLGGGVQVTRSSPYIDYATNTAFIGSDTGVLFKIKDVFACNANLSTLGGCSSQDANPPSLDASFGSGGSVTVAAGVTLTGPIQNPNDGSIVVGGSDGNVYLVDAAGTVVRSLVVGNATATGAVVESPIVDSSNNVIYAVSGNGTDSSGAAAAVLVEASADLTTTLAKANLGTAGNVNIHAPAFDDAYFTDTASGHIMACGIKTGTGVGPRLFRFPFTAGTPPVINTGAGIFVQLATARGECAPLTENLAGGVDRVFAPSGFTGTNGFATLKSFDTAFTGSSAPLAVADFAAPIKDATSGLAIDNVDPNDSNIYFTTLGASTFGTCPAGNVCAYKLTQTTLE